MEDVFRQIIRIMIEKSEIKQLISDEIRMCAPNLDPCEESLQECCASSINLSRIMIDHRGRLKLLDYGEVEVPIKGYQAKVVYILYLLTPKGIANDDLCHHKPIMEKIFDAIVNYKYQDVDRASDVINGLLKRNGGVSDATNKINAALRQVIEDPEVLQHYLILGKRKGLRQINLAKDMVVIAKNELKEVKNMFK